METKSNIFITLLIILVSSLVQSKSIDSRNIEAFLSDGKIFDALKIDTRKIENPNRIIDGINTEDVNEFNEVSDNEFEHDHESEDEKIVITALHPFLHKPFLNWLRNQMKDDKNTGHSGPSETSYVQIKCNPRTGVKDCGPCSTCTCNSGRTGLHEVCTCERTLIDNLLNYFKNECH